MFAPLSLSFHRGPVRAWLFCRGGTCWFEVWFAAPQVDAVVLEIMLQSRTSTGWPQGAARCLFQHTINLEGEASGTARRGRVTLPYRLPGYVLEACHWRVTPCTTSGSPADATP